MSYLKKQGDAITCVTQAIDENPTAGSPTPDSHGTETHRRSTERAGRPSILHGPGDPIGVVTSDGVILMGGQPVTVGSTTSGHIRKQSKSQVKRLHLPVSRPTGSGDRRVELLVAKQGTVCVSTNLYHPAIPPRSEGGTPVQGPPASTLDYASDVVGSPEQLSEETAPASTDIAGDASSATLGPRASQSPGGRPTPGMPGEERLKALGFSDSVIKRIETSRASSTRKHYRSQWKLFLAWTTEKTESIGRFAASVDKLYGLPVQREEGQCAYHPEL